MSEAYANVTIAHKIHSDRRFDLLGELGGWSRREAAMRMVELWSRCTALQTDRPASEEIRIHLGANGERLLVDAGLGERCNDGSIRVRGGGLSGGDVDRFSWFAPVQAQQREAGAKRARMPGARGSGGKFQRNAGPAVTSETTSAGPATTSGSPAVASASPASGFRIPDPEKISLPRAIPPSTEQEPVPAAPPATTVPAVTIRPASGTENGRNLPVGDPAPANQPTREDRKAVRDAIRAEINAARVRVGARLGTPLHPVLPFDRGLDSDLTGQLALATTRADLEALAIQARHAVAMAELEVIAEPERVQFLTGAIFSGGNFARLAGKTAATARAGPKRSAARAIEQPMMRVSNLSEEDSDT